MKPEGQRQRDRVNEKCDTKRPHPIWKFTARWLNLFQQWSNAIARRLVSMNLLNLQLLCFWVFRTDISCSFRTNTVNACIVVWLSSFNWFQGTINNSNLIYFGKRHRYQFPIPWYLNIGQRKSKTEIPVQIKANPHITPVFITLRRS